MAVSTLQKKSKEGGLVLRESKTSHKDGKQMSHGMGPRPRPGAKSSGTRLTARTWDLTPQREHRTANGEKPGLAYGCGNWHRIVRIIMNPRVPGLMWQGALHGGKDQVQKEDEEG